MISVNQGIGTSVPKTWGRGEGGNMFLIKEGGDFSAARVDAMEDTMGVTVILKRWKLNIIL